MDTLATLKQQNRLLKAVLAVSLCFTGATILLGAGQQKTKFAEIDVERVNVVDVSGKPVMVLSNSQRLPKAVIDGKPVGDDRNKPGILFYNDVGDESGGLIFSGKKDKNGKPDAGMHFSMDRFGGDQQLALGHYENDGYMMSGLQVFDRGLHQEYSAIEERMKSLPDGKEKQALAKQFAEAGGHQTNRVFLGKTRGKSSALILADAQGKARIMMVVAPDGKAELKFLDGSGNAVQTFPSVQAKQATKE
jgi:hypothetical protein